MDQQDQYKERLQKSVRDAINRVDVGSVNPDNIDNFLNMCIVNTFYKCCLSQKDFGEALNPPSAQSSISIMVNQNDTVRNRFEYTFKEEVTKWRNTYQERQQKAKEEHDALLEQVEQLKKQNSELERKVEEQSKQIEEKDKMIEERDEYIAEVVDQLRKTSRQVIEKGKKFIGTAVEESELQEQFEHLTLVKREQGKESEGDEATKDTLSLTINDKERLDYP